jgi:hypothetical protein
VEAAALNYGSIGLLHHQLRTVQRPGTPGSAILMCVKEVDADLKRSGYVDWNYGAGDDLIWMVVVGVIAFVANVLVNLLVFRGGWTIHVCVTVDDKVRAKRKVRYRRKAAALADLARQRELAADLPLSPLAPRQAP